MKNNRREFCKMIASVAVLLPLTRIMATNETGEENPKITGYAHKYGIFTDVGFPYSFREKIKAGAFDDVLATGDLDIPCFKNFDHKLILGSTKEGTLRLGTDAVGLWYKIDLPDTKVGRDTREEIRQAGINGVSLVCSSFVVAEDNWDCGIDKYLDDIPERTITRFKQIFAVSLNIVVAQKFTPPDERLRIFNIPPHKLGSLDRANFSNIVV